MKLSKAFSLIEDLRLSLMAAIAPAIAAVIQSPLLIFKPHALMRLIFFQVWCKYGGCADQAGSEVKKDLITPHAQGIVLDIGAGTS
ncbi:MAG TPA: hypothetical protein VGO47_10375 [Chlamydiales bacterium]|jgi:hypothetical protein|nr:hypothetical protein [Chlamydiales bacterium]